jgi:hypothetical protein
MSAPQLKSKTDTVPITELTLKADKQLLVILTPQSPKNNWWRERKGLLSLRPDGVIVWHSDDFINTEPYGRSMTDIKMGFKKLFKGGWDVLLSENNSVWHELSFGNCDYLNDSVVIPVYPSTFTLGDRN